MIDDSAHKCLEQFNLMFFIGVSAFNCTYMLISSQNAFTVKSLWISAQETLAESLFHYSDLLVHYPWSRPTPEESEVPLVFCFLCFFFLSFFYWCVCSQAWRIGCVIEFGSLSLSFCISVSWDMSSSSNSHTDTDAQQYRVRMLICLLSITLSSSESVSL